MIGPTLFYSGTSNLLLPVKKSEYPEPFQGASRLTYYAHLNTSLEVNATFYKLPKPATIENWGTIVPDAFRFTFKAPKTVTHAKDLQFSFDELERFIEILEAVGERKGCILVQLPPKVGRDKEEELSGILESLKDGTRGWNIAVEFRHPSWYTSAVYRMLQNYGAGMVEQDMPKAPTPITSVSDTFAYLRFHGPEGDYRGSYTDESLRTYASRITDLLKSGKEVYAYFNNTAGAALSNLQKLNGMVQEAWS